MMHLKRSLGIGLWFMFLTLPLMVVRVNTVSKEVEWRWTNLFWVGVCAFAIAWFWQSPSHNPAAAIHSHHQLRQWDSSFAINCFGGGWHGMQRVHPYVSGIFLG